MTLEIVEGAPESAWSRKTIYSKHCTRTIQEPYKYMLSVAFAFPDRNGGPECPMKCM